MEDKLDARMMVAEPIHIRCAVPPTSKKVALAFPAWLVFQHGTVDSNIFAKSLLLQDKTLSLVSVFSCLFRASEGVQQRE